MVIGFIGLGNMASAMIGGILGNGLAAPEEILGSARTKETCERIKKEYEIETTTDNVMVASNADILFLAVKPQMFPEVLSPIAGVVKKDALIVSIAAGRSLKTMKEIFGQNAKLIRLMPNTPALVNEGCTAVCPNENVSQTDLEKVLKICRSFGTAEVIPERLIDAFSAVAGCSPAYVFMFIEALADAGVKAGIPRDKAYRFASQAVLGSAKLQLATGKHPGELKDMVCSPGGTTIEAVQVLENMGLRAAVMEAVEAAVEKAKRI
ncbi:MAG: pyrroline-5-carboxylate reductase [Lachnospiraceae bacterium]|nr:pyrroline-5-carboxylate reductase [Lachnospiraceae bacterium]